MHGGETKHMHHKPVKLHCSSDLFNSEIYAEEVWHEPEPPESSAPSVPPALTPTWPQPQEFAKKILPKRVPYELREGGCSLEKGPIFIYSSDSYQAFPFPSNKIQIIQSKRIGISKGDDLDLRFYIKQSPFISKI